MEEEACPNNKGYCLGCCFCPEHLGELDPESYTVGHRAGIKTAIARLEARTDQGDQEWDAFVQDAVAVILELDK